MTIYRVYSDVKIDCQFPHFIVRSAVVLANSEQEARDIVKKEYGDNFVCDVNDTNVEIISNGKTPMVLEVSYVEEGV
jgi:hypothetical protein